MLITKKCQLNSSTYSLWRSLSGNWSQGARASRSRYKLLWHRVQGNREEGAGVWQRGCRLALGIAIDLRIYSSVVLRLEGGAGRDRCLTLIWLLQQPEQPGMASYFLNAWLWGCGWRREWQPTPAFLPGEFHGQRSYHQWGHKDSDTTEGLSLPWGCVHHFLMYTYRNSYHWRWLCDRYLWAHDVSEHISVSCDLKK